MITQLKHDDAEPEREHFSLLSKDPIQTETISDAQEPDSIFFLLFFFNANVQTLEHVTNVKR